MTPVSTTLREAADEEMARRQAQRRMSAAQQASSQIAGRLMGAPAPAFERDPAKREAQQAARAAQIAEVRAGIEPSIAQQRATGQLQEFTPTAQYRSDPMEALRMAMTPAGLDAMRINPFLQAPLQAMVQPPEPVKGTDDMREYAAAQAQGYKGSFMEYLRDIKGASAPRFSVDMSPKASEAMLPLFAKRLDEQYNNATGAENTLYSISVMEQSLASGAPSGAFAQGVIGASQFLDSLGIDYNKDIVANAQAFQAQASNLLANIMAQLGGARGITEGELKLLQQQFPQIVDSIEARRAVFRILRKGSERTIQQYNNTLNQFQKAYPDAVLPYAPKVIIDEKKMRDFINSPEGQAELERIRQGG